MNDTQQLPQDLLKRLGLKIGHYTDEKNITGCHCQSPQGVFKFCDNIIQYLQNIFLLFITPLSIFFDPEFFHFILQQAFGDPQSFRGFGLDKIGFNQGAAQGLFFDGVKHVRQGGAGRHNVIGIK